MKKTIKTLIFGAFLALLSFSLFAEDTFPEDTFSGDDFPENELPENELPNDAPEAAVTDEDKGIYEFINDELQKNLSIVVSRHNFDLNPHTSAYSIEAQILTGLYEGLFSYDPITLNPEYALAESYRISRDKKRWTFIIRKGALTSDGNPITSEVIRNSWFRLLETKNAPFSSLFDIVKGAKEYRNGKVPREDVGITCPDENTISIHLNAPASHLPKILCMASFAVVPDDINVFSGPFTIRGFDGTALVLEKNQNYWDKKHTPLEKISFILSSDQSENAYLFNTGLADWVSSAIDVKRIIQKDTYHLCAEFATEYLFFKHRYTEEGNKSLWSRKEFREALLEAVPWEKLREDTFVKATTLVYPLAGYPKVQGYVYTDKEEAVSMMKECRRKNGIELNEPLKIVFAINESERMKEQAKILKEAWEPLGVTLETVEIPASDYLSKIEETEADLYSYTWIGDFADPLAFLELFRKNSTMNISGWENDEFERLIEEASLITDEMHSKLLAEAEQILLDDAELLPIQHPVSFNVIDLNSVGGWASNSFDIHPLKYLFKRETKPNLQNVVILK